MRKPGQRSTLIGFGEPLKLIGGRLVIARIKAGLGPVEIFFLGKRQFDPGGIHHCARQVT